MNLPQDYSPEAEEGIIGLCLNGDQSAIDYLSSIDPEAFQVPMNQMLCEAIKKVISNDRSMVSIDTVSEQLISTEPAELDSDFENLYEELGGRELLEDMSSSLTAIRGNTSQLHDQVIGYYIKRTLGTLGVQFMREIGRAEVWNVPTVAASILHEINSTISTGVKRNSVDLFDGSVELMKQWIKIKEGEVLPRTVPDHIAHLHKKTGGKVRGETSIWAARPEVGKTSYVLGDAFEAAKKGSRVVFVSMEMSLIALITRLATLYGDETGLQALDIREGKFTDNDIQRASEWFTSQTSNIYFKVISNETDVDKILPELVGLNRDDDIDLVCFDFVQSLEVHRKGRFFKSRGEEIAFAYKQIVMAAKRPENNWHNAFIAHLNREIEGRSGHRPKKSDLGETDKIVQWADSLFYLDREGYYSDTKEDSGDIADRTRGRILNEKFRGAGAISDTPLYYNVDYGRWECYSVVNERSAREKMKEVSDPQPNIPYGSTPIAPSKMNDDEDIPF